MRGKYVSAVGLLQAAAIVTIVFSIVTALPIDHYGIQLFTHFKPHDLVVAVALCVAFVLLRQPVYITGLLLAIGLNAFYVIPWYIGSNAIQADRPLKLLHANVLSRNTEYGRLMDLLDSESPDVVLLQEISPEWLVALDPLRQDYPYSYAEAREGNFGIALFSRVPFTSVSHIDSPPLGYPTIIATMDVDGATVHLVGSHPTIPISTQLYTDRNEQLASIADLLEGLDAPQVLFGDLNASMWDMNYRSLEKDTGLRNARAGFGIVPTWPTFLPFAMIPIDHFLVSDDISVVEMRSGPRIGSDHLPLIATIAL